MVGPLCQSAWRSGVRVRTCKIKGAAEHPTYATNSVGPYQYVLDVWILMVSSWEVLNMVAVEMCWQDCTPVDAF